MQFSETTSLVNSDPHGSCQINAVVVASPKPARWPHQQAAIGFVLPHKAPLLDVAMGGGKSRIVCDALNAFPFDAALIIRPASVLSTWRRELSAWCVLPDDAIVTLDKRRGNAIAKQLTEARSTGKQLIVVTNYESARVKGFVTIR